MANIDSTDLQATLSANELVDRFAMVLFYYTMGGESWSNQACFLGSSLNIGSWNSTPDFFTILGVLGCNNEGSSMVRLELSKFPNSLT
jgi:hypothetical protein